MDTIKNTTSFFQSYDQTRKLFYQKHFIDESKINKVLVITHGLGEHSDAYSETTNSILQQNENLMIISWDLFGHGKSDGRRGYVGDIHWFIDDLKQLLLLVREQYPQVPTYLLSHSLGGLITLHFLRDNKEFNLHGVILSNPCVKLNFTPPKWKTLSAEIFVSLMPSLALNNGLSETNLSSDPDYLQKYKQDNLRHKKNLSAPVFRNA